MDAHDNRVGRSLPPSLQHVIRALARMLAHLSGARVVPIQQETIRRRQSMHGLWLVVTQDCDLDRLAEDESQPVVELRPVFDENPPTQLGLRSRQLLLDIPYYVEAQSGRTMVSPAALTVSIASGSTRSLVSDDRRLALKIWLGLRYDRPAVPEEFGLLARAIAEQIKQKKHRPLARKIRDVLVQFEPGDPTFYSLYAIIVTEVDRDDVETWLSGIALSIPTAVGVSHTIQAITPDETSLTLIESSYSVDASDITWRNQGPEGAYPDGAY